MSHQQLFSRNKQNKTTNWNICSIIQTHEWFLFRLVNRICYTTTRRLRYIRYRDSLLLIVCCILERLSCYLVLKVVLRLLSIHSIYLSA